MWALFLVAFFSFLRKSNLVVENTRSISSSKVLRRSHLILRENTASLRIFATKTIQFAQRSLIPLPVIPGSILCPIAALHTHLNLNQVPASAPLFSVRARGSQTCQAITYSQFSHFLARSLTAIEVDSSAFSPHSFWRGGATFAFAFNWRSDTYLVYLEMTDHQKRAAVTAMAHTLQQLGFLVSHLSISLYIYILNHLFFSFLFLLYYLFFVITIFSNTVHLIWVWVSEFYCLLL